MALMSAVDPTPTPVSGIVEAKPTVVVIGRPMVDAMRLEACITMRDVGGARDFAVLLRTDADVVEMTEARALHAADELQRLVDAIRSHAADIRTLNALETDTAKVLGARPRSY